MRPSNDTEKQPTPPLGLPTGSVRAVLALLLVGTVCVMCGLGRAVPDPLWAAMGVALAMYFGARGNGEAK